MAQLLGARFQKDERSRNFQALMAPAVHTVRHTHYGPVLDQWVGSCTGGSGANNLNCRPLHKRRAPYKTETDMMEIYHLATTLDPWPGVYPPDDTGSSVLAAAQAAQQLGHIQNYRWCFGFDQMLGALMLSPVVVGTNWLSAMFNPNDKGFIDVTGTVAGGHAYLIVGYAAKARYFTMLNSWGIGWSKRGYAKIPEAGMRKLIEDDGEATVYV